MARVALVALGLALFLVFWPVGVALLVLAAVCLTGAVRGWRFPGEPPPPDPLEGLSRKARRYVEVEPEWSVDFLEPVVTHAMSEPGSVQRARAAVDALGTIPLRNAQREPVVDFRASASSSPSSATDGKLVHERVEARWSSNPLPQARQQLEPESAACARPARRSRSTSSRGSTTSRPLSCTPRTRRGAGGGCG